VVFPEPLGPVKIEKVPRSKVKSKFRKILWMPKFLFTRLN
jgi:hypothetical protein